MSNWEYKNSRGYLKLEKYVRVVISGILCPLLSGATGVIIYIFVCIFIKNIFTSCQSHFTVVNIKQTQNTFIYILRILYDTDVQDNTIYLISNNSWHSNKIPETENICLYLSKVRNVTIYVTFR